MRKTAVNRPSGQQRLTTVNMLVFEPKARQILAQIYASADKRGEKRESQTISN